MDRSVGPYQLVTRLAVGGEAEIYLARKQGVLGFEQRYALKILLPHHQDDEERRKMMVDEARLTAQLDHPNIVKVHDLGEDDGLLYMVMEHLNGLNLAQMLVRASALDREIPIEAAVYIAREVCGGLHYAHTRRSSDGSPMQLVHRDVSPQNILVGFGGEVKLVDFGVAKAALGGRLETKTGIIKGKLTYMAPEYAIGSRQDHRSDIFAAGLCLYEMVSGRAAYDIEDARELVEAVKKARIQRPSAFREGVPPGLEKILERALEERVEDRWESAHEMQRSLTEFLTQYAPDYRKEQLAAWIADLREHPADGADSAPARPVGASNTRHGLPAVEDDEDLGSLVATQAMTLEDRGFKRAPQPAQRETTLGMPSSLNAEVAQTRKERREDLLGGGDPPATVETDDDDDDAVTAVLRGGAEGEGPPRLGVPREPDDDPTPAPGIQIGRGALVGDDVANLPTAQLDVQTIAPERAAPTSELPTATDLDVQAIRSVDPSAVTGPSTLRELGVSPPAIERLPAPLVHDEAIEQRPAVIDAPHSPKRAPPPLQKRTPGLNPPQRDPNAVQPRLSATATSLITRLGERYDEVAKTESGRRWADAIIITVLGVTLLSVLVYIFFFAT